MFIWPPVGEHDRQIGEITGDLSDLERFGESLMAGGHDHWTSVLLRDLEDGARDKDREDLFARMEEEPRASELAQGAVGFSALQRLGSEDGRARAQRSLPSSAAAASARRLFAGSRW
jgi:hypothetical protein